MAGKRFWIKDAAGLSDIPTIKVQVAAATGVLEEGMLAKFSSNGSPYAIPCENGDHTIGTDTAMYGLVAKDSTHTATADGIVECYVPMPGIVYTGFATTSTNVNTQAKINALVGDRVGIDVSATTTAGNWTIDEDEGETQALAFQIVGGDPDKYTIDFIIRLAGTYIGDIDLA